MKKKILIGILLLLGFITGCEKNYLKSIDYNQFMEKIEKKETFVVEVVQTGCSACKDFTPRFNKIINKYSIEVFQINYSSLSEKEKEEFDASFSISSTPTVFFVTKGEETSVLTRMVGSIENDKIINKLKAAGYIK